jgi:uncharacterized protein (TIGR03435 family)
MRSAFLLALFVSLASIGQAQTSGPQFDVVSIKHNASTTGGGGGRTFPDGSQRMVNMAVRQFIQTASPSPTREVIGLPDWATTERYDVEVKPPAGSTREQIKQMWQAMWVERFRLAAHIEQRERDVFSMVLARSDGTLGPDLNPSPNDCSPPKPGTPPPAAPTAPPTDKEIMSRCGMRMGAGTIVSGGMKLDNLAFSISGLAGGEIFNDTALDGFYSITLKFSPRRSPQTLDPGAAPSAAAPSDDAPDIFTALQEQLGLKLVRGKRQLPVLVIDHIERPSEN